MMSEIEVQGITTMALRLTQREFESGFFVIRGIGYKTLVKQRIQQVLIAVQVPAKDWIVKDGLNVRTSMMQIFRVPVAMIAQIPSLGRMKCNYITFDCINAVPVELSEEDFFQIQSKMNNRTIRSFPDFGGTEMLQPQRLNEMDFGQVLGALDTMYTGKRSMNIKIVGQTEKREAAQVPQKANEGYVPRTQARIVGADDIA